MLSMTNTFKDASWKFFSFVISVQIHSSVLFCFVVDFLLSPLYILDICLLLDEKLTNIPALWPFS